MAAHHKYSASGAEGWMTCHGKSSMEFGLPDENTVYSMEGSAAHFLAAECLIHKLDTVDFAGKWIAVCTGADGKDYECFAENVKRKKDILMQFEVVDEMADAVQVYVDHVRSLSEDSNLFVETRVCFGALTQIGDAFGTSDAIVLSKDGETLTVVDLKYGFRKVSAFRNKQMMLYAIGALDYLSPVVAMANIFSFKMVIVQPRLGLIDTWETSLQEIMDFAKAVKTEHDKCLEAEASLVSMTRDDWLAAYIHPSEKGCEWCKAKPNCVPLAASVMSDTQSLVGTHLNDDFPDLDFDEAYAEAVKSLQVLPMEALGDAYAFVKRHQLYIDSIEKAFYDRMANGERDDRFKMVAGRKGTRKWRADVLTKKEDELRFALNQAGFIYEAFLQTKPISPAEADRRFKKYPELLNHLARYVEQDETKPIIVRSDDKRASIADGGDFKNLNDDQNLLQAIEFDERSNPQ